MSTDSSDAFDEDGSTLPVHKVHLIESSSSEDEVQVVSFPPMPNEKARSNQPPAKPPSSRKSKPMNRYFGEEDISTKCYRCQGVGHIARDCPNEAVDLPCYLCGKLGHESGKCPTMRCVKCGRKGHWGYVWGGVICIYICACSLHVYTTCILNF